MSQSHPYTFAKRDWVKRKITGRIGIIIGRSDREAMSDRYCFLSLDHEGEPKEEWLDEYELEAAPADQHPFPDPFVTASEAT